MDIQAIKQAFPQRNIPLVGSYYSEYIEKWKKIFENNPPWKKVKKGGLYKKGTRDMNTLNAAKVLCDCFSELTFSEQCEITIDDDEYQKYINEELEQNGFWDNMPELISNAYALGGCAIKVYEKIAKPRINYVHADKFLPVSWTGKTVTDGSFVTVSQKNGRYYTLIEMESSGKVEYKLFKSETRSTLGVPCILRELYNCDDVTNYGTNVPMFAYFKPCVSNNAEYDTPLGMSIYANSIDTLKALDVAFDSFSREFVLGKKRIIVPSSAIQTVVDTKTGKLVKYFDSDDEAFVALKSDDRDNLKITDNTVELRVQEHVSAINALLNILCFQVGLSPGTLSFDAVQGMKTATEVISQDSKTARTIKSNKNLLTEAIETVIHALIAVGVHSGAISKKNYKVTIGWKDNIVIDDNTLIDNNIKLVQAGLKSKVKAIMEVQKCDEATALKELKQIANEAQITGLSVDNFMNGGENYDEA